jgi:cysteine desulfurase/selenocysteine lyase
MSTESVHEDYYFLLKKELEVVDGLIGFDVSKIRKDFPILSQRVNDKPLVWLDNAATTQKPQCVIDALTKYYSNYNSNVHRGAHTLARKATEAYDAARNRIKDFIGAKSFEEIVFVRGATEGINLVAESFGKYRINFGDEILLSQMEHHSNIVPWQALARTIGAKIKVIPINNEGEIIIEEYKKLLSNKTKIVSLSHVSNVLGTINPIRVMIEVAHKYGAKVLIDGAQAVPHLKVNMAELDADFYVFSGHKIYGPTGIGVLYGKKELLEEMEPWQRGGGMIKNVSFESTEYNTLPHKFEAGTGNIGDAIALSKAVDYIDRIGMNLIEQHEKKLTKRIMNSMEGFFGLRQIGTSKNKTSVVSFVLDGKDSSKIASILNEYGIAVRGGHHCAQPVLTRFGLESTVRASVGIYNTYEEVDYFVDIVKKLL